ncbi:hypothetical protein ACW9HQ_35225 [Nocardia gipuzkoensis]
MKKLQIEMRVNELVEHVVAGGNIEDEFVEAKAVWPTLDKAGQLAGMANAAHGQPVMLIIGLDEKAKQIVALDDTDPADWWPQMRKQFAFDVTPDLEVLTVATDHGVVVCLHFETDRAPYMVKIQKDWATAALPWRSGTRTRSATRSELLSILRTKASVPALELVKPVVTLESKQVRPDPPIPGMMKTEGTIKLTTGMFIDSDPGAHVVMPRHRWSVKLQLSTGHQFGFNIIQFTAQPNGRPSNAIAKPSNMIFAMRGDDREINPYGVSVRQAGLVVLGPDLVHLSVSLRLEEEVTLAIAKAAWVEMTIDLPVGTTEQAARLGQRMMTVPIPDNTASKDLVAAWRPAQEAETNLTDDLDEHAAE